MGALIDSNTWVGLRGRDSVGVNAAVTVLSRGGRPPHAYGVRTQGSTNFLVANGTSRNNTVNIQLDAANPNGDTSGLVV